MVKSAGPAEEEELRRALRAVEEPGGENFEWLFCGRSIAVDSASGQISIIGGDPDGDLRGYARAPRRVIHL
jgi:hypothetical protein